MTTNWLDTLDFLSPEQRAVLREHDLDEPAALGPFSAEQIAKATGLSLGRAGRLLSAAKPQSGAPAVTNVVVHAAEELDRATKVQRALEAAAADPTKVVQLAALDVVTVVLGTAEQPEGDMINVAATLAMLRHAASGAPVGTTWGGLRIAKVRDLIAPTIFCNPRTGRALQDGRDEISLVPWAELGRDNLRLAAFGYSRGLFDGWTEDTVFKMVRTEAPLRQRIIVMAKADGVDLASMDNVVVWRASGSHPSGSPARNSAPAEAPRAPVQRGGNPWVDLQRLLLSLFSADELRRFVRYLPDGEDLLCALPGESVSLAKFVSDFVDIAQRRRLVDRDLRLRLRAERPSRAGEVDAVFDALGA